MSSETKMSRIGGRIVRSAAWTAAEVWGRNLVMLLILVVLARQLGTEAFGLAALAMVAPIILSIPVIYGLPDALVQRAEIEAIHFDSAFWLLVATGLGLSGSIWMLAGAIAAVFGEPQLEQLLRWTSAIVAIQALAAVPTAVLKRQLEFRLFALRTMVGTAVGGALGITMALLEFGVWSLVGMQLAKASTETCILLVFSKWRPRLRFSYVRCRDLFGFAGPLVLQQLWTIFNEELPKVVLGAFLGIQAVGIYAFARKPLDILTQCFLGPLMAVTMPAVSRVQQDAGRIDRFFDTSVRMGGLTGFAVYIGFAAIAPEAIPLIFGAHWSEAVLAVQVLMLLGVVLTVDGVAMFTLLGLGHSRLLLRLNIIYTAFIVLLLPAATLINLEVTLLALVLCKLLVLPILLYLAQRTGGIDVLQPLAIFPRLATAGLTMFSAVTIWRLGAPAHASDLTIVAVGIGIGIVAYGAVVVTLIRPDLVAARDTLLAMRRPG